MTRDTVTVSATINAPRERVWRLLTVDRHVWWPDMRFDAVVGAPLRETWMDGEHEASATGNVTRCDEPRLLAFEWREPRWHRPLEVEIRLTTSGASTVVILTETGFSHAGTAPSLPAEHEDGWRYHLARLTDATEEKDPGLDPDGP